MDPRKEKPTRPFDTAALMALAAIPFAPTGAFALSPSDAEITTKGAPSKTVSH